MKGHVAINIPASFGDLTNVDPGVDSAGDGFYEVKVSGGQVSLELNRYEISFSGLWRLRESNIYPMTSLGFIDANHSTSIGTRTAGAPMIAADVNDARCGGFAMPFRCRLKKLKVIGRQNAAGQTNWGFFVLKQARGTDSATGTMIVDDIEASVNRALAANVEEVHNLELGVDTHFQDITIQEGELVCFGVSGVGGDPANNQYQINSALMEFERIAL